MILRQITPPLKIMSPRTSIDNIHQRATEILSAHNNSHVTIYGNTYWSKDIARLIRKITYKAIFQVMRTD